MKHPSSARDPNLDLLRALAIGAVVAAHLTVMCPVHRPHLIAATWSGQFGVDLFFVLSGWLIGGLYFREWQARGSVKSLRFIARRALRTMPPYFAALPVAWLAARVFKSDHPHFATGYLLFLQNYFGTLPYFSVSWSLCIEEHFYVALPVLLGLMQTFLPRIEFFFYAALCVSPLCRIFFYNTPTIDAFNSSVFATHVHLDGLVFGVWAAWLRVFRPQRWAGLAAGCRRWTWLAAALLLPVYWIPPRLFYCVGYTYVSALFAVLIAGCAGAPALPAASTAVTRAIALGSYSVYLTHALVLHAARQLALPLPAGREIIYYLSALGGTAVAGAAFYFMIERTAFHWRDRIVPKLA